MELKKLIRDLELWLRDLKRKHKSSVRWTRYGYDRDVKIYGREKADEKIKHYVHYLDAVEMKEQIRVLSETLGILKGVDK